MSNYCISWLDKTDIEASKEQFLGETGSGPILNTIAEKSYSAVFVLNGYKNNPDADSFCYLLQTYLQDKVEIREERAEIENPVHFKSIYHTASSLIANTNELKSKAGLDILISTGSAVMHGVWFILANEIKFKFSHLDISLISSSRESGVESLPLLESSLSPLAETIAR